MRSGVYGMSWEPGPPARHTLARAAWRPHNLDDGAMKKILVGAAAFGCRRCPSGAGKTEIPVNMRRLLGPIGDVPPAEFEAQYYEQAAVA